MSDQEKQEKVVFSWQVIEEEDGSFRSEVHASPDWQEHKWGPRHHRGPWGCGFEIPPFPMFLHMKFEKGRRARRRHGRDHAHHMLDWMEQMYDEFYDEGPAEEASAANEA